MCRQRGRHRVFAFLFTCMKRIIDGKKDYTNFWITFFFMLFYSNYIYNRMNFYILLRNRRKTVILQCTNLIYSTNEHTQNVCF